MTSLPSIFLITNMFVVDYYVCHSNHVGIEGGALESNENTQIRNMKTPKYGM